ncbi:GNAT family N-acetyltransferase [Actinomyces sp. ZJ308]|uniref:GNAT family N-acetyltransferase n=1 Tax=Actinomyces sp. ZJ308 TaxID=2708342 RepID=UPI00142133B3|nr:GNAT family N-acetyltransferase [Actinomyces sp. ZJ308]
MTEADLEGIARLEGELFGAEAWSRDLLAAELEATRGALADRRYVVVESDAEPDVEPDGAGEEHGAGHADSPAGLRPRADTGATRPRLLGYAGLYHAGGLSSADLLTIVTVPDARGRGLASRMLAELVDTARKAGCPDVLLEVRQSNETAQGLYARHGFVPIGRRRRYYQAPPEDAVVMRLTLRPRLGPVGTAEAGEPGSG